mmetsp:Transcript_20914/g.51874  ORF Transcript_20914/g.51874 Transcript_20914/m.51874 type:complete len:204 (-) Transcript_20914:37-648(-)
MLEMAASDRDPVVPIVVGVVARPLSLSLSVAPLVSETGSSSLPLASSESFDMVRLCMARSRLRLLFLSLLLLRLRLLLWSSVLLLFFKLLLSSSRVGVLPVLLLFFLTSRGNRGNFAFLGIGDTLDLTRSRMSSESKDDVLLFMVVMLLTFSFKFRMSFSRYCFLPPRVGPYISRVSIPSLFCFNHCKSLRNDKKTILLQLYE